MLYTVFCALAMKPELSPYEENLYNQCCIMLKVITRIRTDYYDQLLRQLQAIRQSSQQAPEPETPGEAADQS
jgi:hypothetical protein